MTRAAVLWGVAALVVVLAFWPLELPISNDGTQYLSGAQNLLARRGYATSILFFDEHYSFGTIPAPQTVWPPGYSALIAAFSAPGMSLESAARLSGQLSYIVLLPLVFGLAYRATSRREGALLATLWTFSVTEVWLYTAAPNSELPFLAFSTAALLAVPRWGQPGGRWILPGMLAAAAATTRYAGAFLIFALGLAALWTVWRNAKEAGRLRPAPLGWLALGASPFALVLLRNLALVGSLQGGNSKPASQPVAGLLDVSFRALVDLMSGASLTDLRAGGWSALAAGLGVAGATLLAVLVVTAIPGLARGERATTHDPALVAVLLYPVVYLPALLWTASRTMLTYGGRYLLPVLPAIMLIAVRLLLSTDSQPSASGSWARRWRLGRLGVAAILVAQVGALGRRVDSRGGGTPFRADPIVTAYVRDHLGPGEPILAVGNGQQVGHLLQRPTAAVPHQWFTARPWDEAMVRGVLDRYGIRTVVVFSGGGAGDVAYGPFLDSLIAGNPPPWLAEVASSGRFRILAPRSALLDRTGR